MAKRQKALKEQVVNKDSYARINFLAQAARLSAMKAPVLSRRLIHDMREVAKKSQIRIDGSLKLGVCKVCAGIAKGTTPAVPSEASTEAFHFSMLIACHFCGKRNRNS
jgi:RNase P subunit RPR2